MRAENDQHPMIYVYSRASNPAKVYWQIAYISQIFAGVKYKRDASENILGLSFSRIQLYVQKTKLVLF